MKRMEQVVKIDGFEKAIIGATHDNKLIYEYDIMVEILCENQNITKEEAEDFIEYNTIRGMQYVENAPIVVNTKFKPLLFEIEKWNGDTIMCFEVDYKNGKLKTQNCTVSDVESNHEEIFESEYKIRVQQDDVSNIFDGYDIKMEIGLE
jgi:hypothetical protein